MKIAIGYEIQNGPYGGGNSIVLSFQKYFTKAGHEVVFNINDNDVDVILITDPRSRSPSISFSAGAVLRYLWLKNKNAIVIHLLQDCDERKNTKTMNLRQRIANYCADHSVVVGTWMLDLNLFRKEHKKNCTAILNGGRKEIFVNNKKHHWNKTSPLRLITHHWGGNWMKGFDVYRVIDDYLESEKNREMLEFTYIGNVPNGFKFSNVRHLQPMDSKSLSDELNKHHVYITASLNEPAGLHHIEGAMCGLPILFRNSGALPEYCSDYGVMFDGPGDVIEKIQEIKGKYAILYNALAEYPFTEEKMTTEYLYLFECLLNKKNKVINDRNIFRNPFLYILNQIPF